MHSPKCPPNIETHCVKPEECSQEDKVHWDGCKQNKWTKLVLYKLNIFLKIIIHNHAHEKNKWPHFTNVLAFAIDW